MGIHFQLWEVRCPPHPQEQAAFAPRRPRRQRGAHAGVGFVLASLMSAEAPVASMPAPRSIVFFAQCYETTRIITSGRWSLCRPRAVPPGHVAVTAPRVSPRPALRRDLHHRVLSPPAPAWGVSHDGSEGLGG